MKLKGIVLVVILLLASIMMPFDVYAAVQSQIVPTFSSSTSQWNGHLYVTNFSDGTNNQASSTLSFTFDDDYYGIIYFDGYGPSNQHIANYAACFVAGGYGEYRYSYYQNGVINITSVTINIVNVVKPDSSVDLTQIIQLLTAIESDTTGIDSTIRTVLNQLIISNGYLDILTKLRQYNFPVESLHFISYLLSTYDPVNFNNYYSWTYPVFDIPNGSYIYDLNALQRGREYYLIIDVKNNIYNLSVLQQRITFDNSDFTFKSYQQLGTYYDDNSIHQIIKCTFSSDVQAASVRIKLINNTGSTLRIIPYFCNYLGDENFTTDFALIFGFSNRLLNDIHIIANGTTQSNSAASDLESSNDQMADDMNDLATIESGYNQQFNDQLQSIDFTSPIQSNAGILPAANFVISIFNGLINNNPFSVLIIVVCILLIGKKVIGK